MITKIRELSKSFIGKAVMSVVAFTFVGAAFLLWGDVRPRGSGGVAIVYGEPITQQEYYNAISRIESNLREQFGDNINQSILNSFNIDKIAINSLIDNR
ncbi:MAG: SurA N-terminal domain-containing protein, partial [Nitrospinota bacterium]